MFGALTFLPLFLQVVKGVSPTESGVRLFPMMFGLLVTSIVSGQLVSRYGRYKVFPVLGTALMAVGLYLMSLVGVATGPWTMSAYMFVFGAGLGLVMQVLVVAVQNAVPYEELGHGHLGRDLLPHDRRFLGTAVFGAIFANLLAGNLRQALGPVKLPPNAASQIDNPALLAKLPPAIHAGVAEGVAHTVQSVFLVGVPIAVAAFLLSWLLPEVPLRKSIRSTGTTEGMSAPRERTSLEELQHSLTRVTARENRADLYRTLAERAGLDLPPRACWLLYRLAERPGATTGSVCSELKIDPEKITDGLDALVVAGYVSAPRGSTDPLQLTAPGREALERLAEARRAGLGELLEGWDLGEHPELEQMVRDLAQQLLADDDKLLEDARPKLRLVG